MQRIKCLFLQKKKVKYINVYLTVLTEPQVKDS